MPQPQQPIWSIILPGGKEVACPDFAVHQRQNGVRVGQTFHYGTPPTSWWGEFDIREVDWVLGWATLPVRVALRRPGASDWCYGIIVDHALDGKVRTLCIVDVATWEATGRAWPYQWPPPEVPAPVIASFTPFPKPGSGQPIDFGKLKIELTESMGGDGASLLPAKFNAEGGIKESRN